MTQPLPDHITDLVVSVAVILEEASRLADRAGALLDQVEAAPATRATIPTEFSGNVVEVDFSARRRLGVSR